MTYNDLQDGIESTISGLEQIAENGKHHEKESALNAVRELDFFKNYPSPNDQYGEGFCRRLEHLEEKLESGLGVEEQNSTMVTPGDGGYKARTDD